MKQIIGLTGGIGCGKTALAEYFIQLGFPVIDTDQVAKNIVEPEQAGLRALIKLLGNEYLMPSGELNRGKLRETFFVNQQLKQQVEGILHPIIRQTVREMVEKLRLDNRLIFIAIPVIHQLNQPEYQLDYVLLVECDEKLQKQRVAERDGRSQEQIQAIIQQQATPAERQKVADFIIYNNDGLAELHQQADDWLKKILD